MSATALIVLDGFDVTTSGTRFQDNDSRIVYGAGWILGNRDKTYSEGSSAESNTAGALATFTFTGTSVSWISGTGSITGIARVLLDGVLVREVDTYSPTEAPQKTVFTVTGLSNARHQLTIQATGSKNPASGGGWILLDAFDVSPWAALSAFDGHHLRPDAGCVE